MLKRLIRNFLLLSIPLIALSVYALNFPMYFMATEYSLWQEEKDYVNTESGPVKTLIVGDSRAKSSLIPEEGSYNIAIGGSTAIEMYHALKNYLERHEPPESIVLIFAPYHLCEIDNWQQTLFFNYLTVPELAAVEISAIRQGGNEVLNYRGFISDILSFKLRLPNKYMDPLMKASFRGNFSSNIETFERVRSMRGYTEFGTDDGNSDLNYETHHEVFDSSDLILSYYEKLLILMEKSDAENLCVAQSPVNEASSEVISKDFIDGYQSYLTDKQSEHQKISFETEVPVYENKYFGDNNHLNRAGAERFTKEFKSSHTFY